MDFIQNTNYNQNMIYNMVIVSIVGIFINNLTNIFNSILKYFKLIFGAFLVKLYFLIKGYFRREIIGEIVISSTGFFTESLVKEASSANYKAVMYQLYKRNINIFKVRELFNNINNFGNYERYDADEFIIDYSGDIIIDNDNDIKLICYEDSITTGNNKTNNILKIYNAKLFSTKLIVSELSDYLKRWVIEYKDYITQYVDDGNLYYFSLKDNPKEPDTSKPKKIKKKWSSHKLVSYKTFDNIFFKDKTVLLQRLNTFLNNKEMYIKRGIPHTLGFLFYGKPGCGKTSCAKAIANYTRRHVVEINLSKIKTCGEFMDIFLDEFIDKTYIPPNKRIIVLEDIDAMINIVKQRNIKEDANLDIKNTLSLGQNSFDEIIKLSLFGDKISKRFKSQDELNLSCILNTIDGILEQQGRIIIISSNFPEKLDSALLRPGRIDLKIEFGMCDKTMIKDIIKNFYMVDNIPTEKLKEDTYTPAELLELCFKNENNINNLLSIVKD